MACLSLSVLSLPLPLQLPLAVPLPLLIPLPLLVPLSLPVPLPLLMPLPLLPLLVLLPLLATFCSCYHATSAGSTRAPMYCVCSVIRCSARREAPANSKTRSSSRSSSRSSCVRLGRGAAAEALVAVWVRKGDKQDDDGGHCYCKSPRTALSGNDAPSSRDGWTGTMLRLGLGAPVPDIHG